MNKRSKRLIALCIAMSLSMSSVVCADEATEISSAECSENAVSESVEDTVSDNEEFKEEISPNSISENISDDESIDIESVEDSIKTQFLSTDELVYDTDLELSSAEISAVLDETAEELSALTSGEDYIADEAMFTTDSEDDAREVAEEYGAELESYLDGVAVLKFDTDVKDVFTAAAESASNNTLIHPNYLLSLDTVNDSAGKTVEFKKIETHSSIKTVSGHNDPLISKQWFLDAISANEAWKVTSGNGVKVAVLDTGCDVNHEDLKNNIAETYSTIDGKTDVTDNVGHGTHCAGTIAAALDNKVGGAGVAPGAKLCIIKVSKSGSMAFADVMKGLSKAGDMGADVVSMSFGGYYFDSSALAMFQNSVNNLRDKGTVLMAAAGNESTSDKCYPASLENVISVAAAGYGMYAENTLDGHTYSPSDPELAWYSNYGTTVDIIAPGGSCKNNTYGSVDNLSTVPGSYDSDGKLETGYAYMAGTSMACPVATGVAALIFSANSDLINDNTASAAEAVENKLISSTDGKTYHFYELNSSVDTGCINAYKAVSGKAEISAIRIARADGTILANNASVYIEKGKSEKLKLVDRDGKPLTSAESKNMTWSSSGTDITVKKGKCKVNKKASVDSTVTVTVSGNDATAKLNFVILEKVKGIYYQKTSKKVAKKLVKSVSLNTSTDISDLPTLVGSDVYAVTGISKVGTTRTYTGYDVNYIGYNIAANKKTLAMIDGSTFTPTKKGSYKVKYVLKDGSKKAFTVTFKVK